MKSRALRSIKVEGSKTKGQSDVYPSTSLPPLVEGQLRCFLRVTISRLVWTLPRPPSATFVRLRWWGESSNGTQFFPRDGSQLSQSTVKTTARFPIRCGPKQFTSYLTDMGSLVLEVITKSDHLPVARAQVAGISCLSLSHPVSGFYALVSPTSEKMGELQVSLNLEALTEAYDSSSSGRTRDMRIEGLQGTPLTAPSQPTSISAGSRKERARSSTGNTPRGKDHLYFQNTQNGKEESTENLIPMSNGHMALNSCQESSGQRTNDILSVILERGNKLRDAMVVSALKSEIDSASTLKITPLPLSKENILPPSKPLASSFGTIHQNIPHGCSTLKRSDDVAAAVECGAGVPADIDNKAVDLLLASVDKSYLPFVDGEDSLCESLSGYSSVCGHSELNDPQYDQSLLENLFYKTPMLDIRPNDPETEGQGTVSGSKKQLTLSGSQMSHGSLSGPKQSADSGLPPGLNGEQMKLLSLIRFARVTINSLTVPTGSATTTSRKTFTKGKTLQPLTRKKSTYFIEYVFPLASTSIQHKSIDGEVTRAVSSKVTEGVVSFHHCSVFPFHISAATVKQWWGTDLMFKIYSRKSYQKKFVLIGKTVHPLSSLLQSKQLSQSVVLPVQSMEGNNEAQEAGALKVAIELAVRKAFPSDKSETALPSRDIQTTQTAFSPERESNSNTEHVDFGREELLSCSFEDSRLNVWSPQINSKEPSPHSSLHTSYKSQQQVEEDPEVLLHTLLMVPDGTNFNCGPKHGPNVYLNCKLFWCDEMTRSVVSWGQTNPSFNFVQVTPIALSNKLLERLKNNMMVIEVWQKMASSGQDRLFGLVKLPLHQFYLSFRDPKITHLLLQSEHPVLGVDSYMPVIDVFSGCCKGNLRVVLAMGRVEQIASLQRTRGEEDNCSPHLVRPVHLLDHQPYSQTKGIPVQKESMREHRFMIKVERVGGLTPLQSTVWGEADCYIQYNFPIQESDLAAEVDGNVIESTVNLKLFRTTTTLCVPDPVFGHSETHLLLAPDGVPVQRLLLSSLSRQGLTNGGGVQFEVWCRYYYPNVRDQLVAKGILPLSKLCAMVTMQRQHPDEAQMFSLPLVPRVDSQTGHQPQPSGLLDVSVQYKHRSVRAEGHTGKGAASRIVTLVVQVRRASGLQAAARIICKQDERFTYYASVGVNTYVTVKFTFLPESERRCTRIVARTFCPEFDHHMEVSCDLLTQMTSGETCSLAEKLEDACAVFTVWHRHSPKDSATHKPKDVMLGTVKVPLADLLHKRTEKGISGWFGVYTPQEIGSSQHQQIMVGGLEISVSFAHHTDKIRVIKAAQGVGWEIAQTEVQDDDEAWRESMSKMSFTFSIPRAWLPTNCLLLPGHSELQRSTYCYFRYRFYDQDAFYSQMRHPSVEGGEEGLTTVTFQGSRNVEVRSTQPLKWYLRDEKLEVQVWVAFTKDKTQKPRDTDRLVGSAFVDLSSFANTPKQKLTLSGVYPLFRCSAADLQGAALRVHITLTTAFTPSEEEAEANNLVDADGQGERFSEEFEAADRTSSPITPKKSQIKHNKSSSTTADVTSMQHAEMSMDESFPVNVAVDRAMHLSLKGCPLAERSQGSPCCCVSYVTVDSPQPVSTAVIANTDCPVWDHQHECRLSKQLLVDPQLSLLFKVWHKGEVERVIGFASVDLSPLQCGFPSVCGWYHITDLSGQCHGQLKVSITPLKRLQDHREQRTTVNENTAVNSSALFQPLLLSYQTTATYSSFPAHISQYPEQKISSPDHTDGLISDRSTYIDRHFEHMDQVRLHHQSLQEQTVSNSICSSSAGEINPSYSVYSALRKKLSDLDNIQRYLSSKFSTPTFPSRSEQDCQTEQEEQWNMDKCLQRQLETIPSSTQSSSTTPPVGDNIPETIPETSGPDTTLKCGHDHIFPPLQKISDGHTDSEPEEMRDRLSFKGTESEEENEDGANKDEDATGCRQDKEADDDEEDEDYEEVMVKPRPLNEVTSLTDKTSPWASILSDPELVSRERLEASDDPNLSPDEDAGWQTTRLQTRDISWPQKCGDEEESVGFSGSTRESSETDGEDERTLEALVERRAEEASGSDEGSSEECSSPTTHDSTDNTHDALTSPAGQGPLQLSMPWEVPNFFLPSDQMEASMRVIRLAPSFSCSIDELQRSPPVLPRAPRQRCNMSPSSRKKEMERIAKIFSAHFDDD